LEAHEFSLDVISSQVIGQEIYRIGHIWRKGYLEVKGLGVDEDFLDASIVVEPGELTGPAGVPVEAGLGGFLGECFFLELSKEGTSESSLVVELEDTQVGQSLTTLRILLLHAAHCTVDIVVLENVTVDVLFVGCAARGVNQRVVRHDVLLLAVDLADIAQGRALRGGQTLVARKKEARLAGTCELGVHFHVRVGACDAVPVGRSRVSSSWEVRERLTRAA
jgi:hypothetical protein